MTIVKLRLRRFGPDVGRRAYDCRSFPLVTLSLIGGHLFAPQNRPGWSSGYDWRKICQTERQNPKMADRQRAHTLLGSLLPNFGNRSPLRPTMSGPRARSSALATPACSARRRTCLKRPAIRFWPRPRSRAVFAIVWRSRNHQVTCQLLNKPERTASLTASAIPLTPNRSNKWPR